MEYITEYDCYKTNIVAVQDRIIAENIELNNDVNIIYHFAIEEMAELTKELTKHMRGNGDMGHLIEELADVYYTSSMLQQLLKIKVGVINTCIVRKQNRAMADIQRIRDMRDIQEELGKDGEENE